jgi:hypothetical protein
MSDWISKVLSEQGFKMPSGFTQVDDKLLDEEIVILLQGKNSFGDPIFSYLKLSLRKFRELTEHVREHKDFTPSDWGTVIAAGTGDPSPELRAEMAITYNLVDVPKPVAQPKKINIAPPPLWDE